MDSDRFGWLPAVVPVTARRFRAAAPPGLDEWLEAAGAELADSSPDVEIAPPREVVGDAQTAVVPLEGGSPPALSRPLRAPVRLIRFARLRARAGRARRRLARCGYRSTRVVGWEPGHALRMPGLGPPRSGLAAAERVPLCALVVGSRREGDRTALEAALEAAAGGAPTGPIRVKRGGVMVAVLERGVLRLGLGPAAALMAAQGEALADLASLPLSPRLQALVPWPLAEGEAGLARWSLERLLPGAQPRSPLPETVLVECVDVLSELHGLEGGGGETALGSGAARVAAEAGVDGLVPLGRRLDRALGHLPRGFGHGDVWAGNLLVEEGRLAGIVDWAGSGRGRLPFLDLLHLLATEDAGSRTFDLERAVGGFLLPLARAGGGPYVRRYAAATGIALEPRLLELLALAYGLDRLGYDVQAGAPPGLIRAQAEVLLRLAGRLPGEGPR